MSAITNIVSLGRLVPGGTRVSGIQGGQQKQRGGRWTVSSQYCALDARFNTAVFELPKHVAAPMSRPTTDIPTTGVPQSAMERRT